MNRLILSAVLTLCMVAATHGEAFYDFDPSPDTYGIEGSSDQGDISDYMTDIWQAAFTGGGTVTVSDAGIRDNGDTTEDWSGHGASDNFMRNQVDNDFELLFSQPVYKIWGDAIVTDDAGSGNDFFIYGYSSWGGTVESPTGTPVTYTKDIAEDTGFKFELDFGSTPVYLLVFSGRTGMGTGPRSIAIDNLSVVPIPATIILGILGLSSVGAVGLKLRKFA